jgi:hypothetical protein
MVLIGQVTELAMPRREPTLIPFIELGVTVKTPPKRHPEVVAKKLSVTTALVTLVEALHGA